MIDRNPRKGFDKGERKKHNGPASLGTYLGFAGQMATGLCIAAWAGHRADGAMLGNAPVLVWALPLLLIGGTLAKTISETGKKNDKKNTNL